VELDDLQPDLLINDLFTDENVKKAVQEVNFKKVLGEDWFCGDLLESGKVGQHLKIQIKNMLNSGFIPKYLKTARLNMLSKK
jgi:hypothetical protein